MDTKMPRVGSKRNHHHHHQYLLAYFFVESFGLKVLSQVTTKLSQLHSNSRNKYVNSRKYHNVGHMRCMHARPHRRKFAPVRPRLAKWDYKPSKGPQGTRGNGDISEGYLIRRYNNTLTTL